MLIRRVLLCTLLAATAASAQQRPIELRVDLTDGPRQLVHVTELLPVHPGRNAFSYPQWLPGAERPEGPIDNLTGLVFHAGSFNGPVMPWRRDLVDMYRFNVEAPAGTTTLAVSFDLLERPSREDTTATRHFTSHVAMLETSSIILYPSGVPSSDIPVTATIHLRPGWVAATALRTTATGAPTLNKPDTTFRTVSLEQFVDSPILAGDHCRQFSLAPEIHPVHTLDVCTDKAADLNLDPALLTHMNGVVEQASKIFQSHHYEHYDFLVAMSEHLDGDSREHTESADYVVKNLNLSKLADAEFITYLLPHEYVHSWCGKYRRPAGIATADYNTPMQNDMIWVYEGLTQYYGNVITARSGFRTPEELVDAIDRETWNVAKPGRRWRPLQDTADAAPILRGGDSAWANWRRGQDFYNEGTLLWLEADMKIREMSHGKKSLDDFAASFFGATRSGTIGDTAPGVFPYTFTDLVAALNAVAPYDWASFWTTRLNALTPDPPTAGLEAAGYSYVMSDTMNPNEAAYINASHAADMGDSLGIFVLPDGTLNDVSVGSPAFIAGLGPNDKLTAVNGKPYSGELLTRAVRDAKTSHASITLTATRDDEPAEYQLDYHAGERYANLKRNTRPDLLTGAILQPRP